MKHYMDIKICKQPRTEVAKKAKTRMAVESLIDRLLATKLIRNDRFFEQILYNKEIVWLQNGDVHGHLFAKAALADQLKTKTNGFMMYMPTNPIVYEVDGELYHLLTRIDSTRAKPNLARLSQEPKPVLSAARVNDLLCSIVMRFYETYIHDLAPIPYTEQLMAFVQQEYTQFLQAVQALNDVHFNWHPRGNGHNKLLQLIADLQMIKSHPGKLLIDFANTHNYVVVKPAYLPAKPAQQAL